MKFKRPKKVHVATLDREDGAGPVRDPKDFMIHLPGVESPLPVVGPTSGKEYQKLREAETEMIEKNRALLTILRKAWKCTQCGKIWRCKFDGAGQPIKGQPAVRPMAIFAPDDPSATLAERMMPIGIDLSRLRCADVRCDGPVVEYNPALTDKGRIYVS